jgi:hypothetical protein
VVNAFLDNTFFAARMWKRELAILHSTASIRLYVLYGVQPGMKVLSHILHGDEPRIPRDAGFYVDSSYPPTCCLLTPAQGITIQSLATGIPGTTVYSLDVVINI